MTVETQIDELMSKVKNRLFHFEETVPNFEELMKLPAKEAEKHGFFIRDFGMKQWDWPQGIGILGLHLESAENDSFIIDWARTEQEKGLPTKNINTITPLLTLMDYPEFEELAVEWMSWIEQEFPKTQEGGLEHITSGDDKYTIKRFHEQIWVDSVFMTVLFMAKMGVKFDRADWRSEATYQVLLHTKYLLDTETSLFYHGWDFQQRSNYGKVFWCRGNSWFVLGLPLFLDIMEGYLDEEEVRYLRQIYQNQVVSLLALRKEDDLWHTLLDDETTYTETSGSSGIMAGILLGLSSGILSDDVISEQEVDEIMQHLMAQIDENGTVQGVSAGTAISDNREDYKKVIQAPMVYGQSMMLVALDAYKKYKQRETSQIVR